MNWDEDIDLMANNKSSAKFGRRAGSRGQDSQDDDSEIMEAPTRVRKTGKWADEGIKSAKKNSTNIIEQERFQGLKLDDSDDIPVIPDIDDLQEDILTLQDSKKPVISVNKATYRELDSELGSLKQNKGLGHLGDVNLSFLTTHLFAEDQVKEVDELWTLEELGENILSCV